MYFCQADDRRQYHSITCIALCSPEHLPSEADQISVKLRKIPRADSSIKSRRVPLTISHDRPTIPKQAHKMAKDKSEKKDKKEKKEKRSEVDGVKKSKKDKKTKLSPENIEAAELAVTEFAEDVQAPKKMEVEIVKDTSGELVAKPVGALVPFAAPLADDKIAKKVLKSVKKGMFLFFDRRLETAN